MKTIFRLGIMVAVLATFTSCSEILPKKVKSIVIKEGKDINAVLQFDSNGRVINLGENEYQYTNNQIIVREKVLGITDTLCEINNGKIVSRNDYVKYKFSYSNKGYLASIFSDDKEWYNFNIENGKIVRCTMFDENYNFLYRDTRNNLNVDFSYFFMTRELLFVFTGFLGERLDYLPSAIINEDNEVTKFYYEYDGKYLTKVTMSDEEDEICFEIYY